MSILKEISRLTDEADSHFKKMEQAVVEGDDGAVIKEAAEVLERDAEVEELIRVELPPGYTGY